MSYDITGKIRFEALAEIHRTVLKWDSEGLDADSAMEVIEKIIIDLDKETK